MLRKTTRRGQRDSTALRDGVTQATEFVEAVFTAAGVQSTRRRTETL